MPEKNQHHLHIRESFTSRDRYKQDHSQYFNNKTRRLTNISRNQITKQISQLKRQFARIRSQGHFNDQQKTINSKKKERKNTSNTEQYMLKKLEARWNNDTKIERSASKPNSNRQHCKKCQANYFQNNKIKLYKVTAIKNQQMQQNLQYSIKRFKQFILNSMSISNVQFSIIMMQLNEILKAFNQICQKYEEKLSFGKRKNKDLKNKLQVYSKQGEYFVQSSKLLKNEAFSSLSAENKISLLEDRINFTSMQLKKERNTNKLLKSQVQQLKQKFLKSNQLSQNVFILTKNIQSQAQIFTKTLNHLKQQVESYKKEEVTKQEIR